MYNIDLKLNGKKLALDRIPVNKEYRESNSKYLSFKNICEKIFDMNNGFIHDGLRVEEVKTEDDEDYFHCQLGLAEWGNERGLYDAKHNIERDPLQQLDKVLEPFFCMFSIPLEKGNDKAFLVIEKKKSKPIMKSFREMFNDKIKEFNEELRIHIVPHNPLELEDIVNDGIVSEYYFSIYENDEDKFEDKELSLIKISIPSLERIHPTDVNKNKVVSRIKNFLKKFDPDTKIKMKVKHSENQEVSLDIDNIFNYDTFYLDITKEIETSKDNPTYDSMVGVCKKYIKSNFSYYVDQEQTTLLEE